MEKVEGNIQAKIDEVIDSLTPQQKKIVESLCDTGVYAATAYKLNTKAGSISTAMVPVYKEFEKIIYLPERNKLKTMRDFLKKHQVFGQIIDAPGEVSSPESKSTDTPILDAMKKSGDLRLQEAVFSNIARPAAPTSAEQKKAEKYERQILQKPPYPPDTPGYKERVILSQIKLKYTLQLNENFKKLGEIAYQNSLFVADREEIKKTQAKIELLEEIEIELETQK